MEYNFNVSKEQFNKYIEWREKLEEEGKHYDNIAGAAGGAFSFNFIPTGIGVIEEVIHLPSGEKLDLTDWDNF
jgi:hypothetical protein